MVASAGKASKPATPSAPSAPYVPWKERNLSYWIKAFDDFATVVVREHKLEMLLLLLASLYALNYVLGSRTNEGIVLKWANTFGLPAESTKSGPPTLYGKNFALVGVDTKTSSSEIIFRDSQSTFKCYASGRRNLKWMMTTLELRKRQDLLCELSNLVMPQSDKLIIEVSMNEGSMQPMVFAVVKKKLSKAFISDHKDVRQFAKRFQPEQKDWPKKKLVVLQESRELFSDLITDATMKNVFDNYGKYEKYFSSMYYTSEGKVPGAKALLRFEFSLPKNPKKMRELEALLELVFHQIDVVGAHKLSPEAFKKAQERRSKIQEEEFKETLQARQEAAQRKREAKFEKEKQSMTAAQAAKAEEKRKNKLLKKQRPKMKMMK